jgi:hypothetical protein
VVQEAVQEDPRAVLLVLRVLRVLREVRGQGEGIPEAGPLSQAAQLDAPPQAVTPGRLG